MCIFVIFCNGQHYFASPYQSTPGDLRSFQDRVLLSVPDCRSDRDAPRRQQHPGLGLSLHCVDRHQRSGPHEISSLHEICQWRRIFHLREQLNSSCRSSFCKADDRGSSTNHLAMAKSIFVYNSLFQRRAIVMPWCFMITTSLLESISTIPRLRLARSIMSDLLGARPFYGAGDSYPDEGLIQSLRVRLSSSLEVGHTHHLL
jgi:hypothetical protein